MRQSTIDFNGVQEQETQTELMIRDERGNYHVATPEQIIDLAKQAIDRKVMRGDAMCSPNAVKDFFIMHLGALEHEQFTVLFLDAQNRVLKCAEMFRGTITSASVYPREVVKEALQCNAAACILAHNHPSGSMEASDADKNLTQMLKKALELIDVRILDHVIVGAGQAMSFAERGLMY